MGVLRSAGLALMIAVIAVLVTGGNPAVAPEHVPAQALHVAAPKPEARTARHARPLSARDGVARARRWRPGVRARSPSPWWTSAGACADGGWTSSIRPRA